MDACARVCAWLGLDSPLTGSSTSGSKAMKEMDSIWQ